MNLNFFRKAFVFLKRDLLINASYKFAFLFDLGSIIFSVLTFFFVARLFGEKALIYLTNYGGDYFSFVLIGIAFSGYLSTAMNSFCQTISEEQAYGTLEAIILSPTKISTLVICGSIWNFLFTSLRIIVYLILGWLFFGLDLSKINLVSSMIILILTIISFSSLGIISAGLVLVLKRGDPINWLFNGLSRFLGGVYFPISILPLWVQKISLFLPLTHSLEGVRKSLILGTSIKELTPQIFMLSIYILIFLPLGILGFKAAIKRAKKDGSLIYT